MYPPPIFAADGSDALVDSPSHRVARAELGRRGTVLDVGCGGGRSSVPLASSASSVTGVDERESMLVNFAAAFDRAGVTHRKVLGRWPDVASDVAAADVVVCHHVVYNVRRDRTVRPGADRARWAARGGRALPRTIQCRRSRHCGGTSGASTDPASHRPTSSWRSSDRSATRSRWSDSPALPASRRDATPATSSSCGAAVPWSRTRRRDRGAPCPPRPRPARGVTVSWPGAAVAAGPLSSRA